jgi:hypothetical protein
MSVDYTLNVTVLPVWGYEYDDPRHGGDQRRLVLLREAGFVVGEVERGSRVERG